MGCCSSILSVIILKIGAQSLLLGVMCGEIDVKWGPLGLRRVRSTRLFLILCAKIPLQWGRSPLKRAVRPGYPWNSAPQELIYLQNGGIRAGRPVIP